MAATVGVAPSVIVSSCGPDKRSRTSTVPAPRRRAAGSLTSWPA